MATDRERVGHCPVFAFVVPRSAIFPTQICITRLEEGSLAQHSTHVDTDRSGGATNNAVQKQTHHAYKCVTESNTMKKDDQWQ